MNAVRRLLPYLRPHWKALLVGSLLALLVAAMDGLLAWLVKPALDEIFVKRDLFMLTILPAAVFGVYLLKGVGRYWQSYLMASVGARVIATIRRDLYSHLQELSLAFFHGLPSAELMSRLINDVNRLSKFSSQVMVMALRQVATIVALVVVMFDREWRLTLIALVAFPLVGVAIRLIGRQLYKINKRTQAKIGELNSVIQEAFVGTKIVKAFGGEAYERARFGRVNQRLLSLTLKDARMDELTEPLMEVLGALGIMGALWYGGSAVIAGTMTPGTFFSFIAAVLMLYGPVRKLSRTSNAVQQSTGAAERIFELMDTVPTVYDAPGARPLPGFQDRIEFHHVWFRYDNSSEDVLRDITFTAARGEVVAFVGMSGAGKSTLADLIPRFHDVTQGRITIDGLDLREVTLASLRAQIGLVTQETFLFNDTVSQNIAYGRLEATPEEVERAARLAFASDFIEALPAGFQTVVGEQGVRLSGGQRQRIAIARALLKDPPILILDEATSDLDAESEFMVQQALGNLMQGRTVIVIAHRLSTIRHADKILVFHEGRIVEEGRHEELLARGGIYQRLHSLQFAQELVDQPES